MNQVQGLVQNARHASRVVVANKQACPPVAKTFHELRKSLMGYARKAKKQAETRQ